MEDVTQWSLCQEVTTSTLLWTTFVLLRTVVIQSVMTHFAQMEFFATPRKLLIEIIGRLFKYWRLYRCQTLHDGKKYSFEQGRSHFKGFLTSYLTFRDDVRNQWCCNARTRNESYQINCEAKLLNDPLYNAPIRILNLNDLQHGLTQAFNKTLDNMYITDWNRIQPITIICKLLFKQDTTYSSITIVWRRNTSIKANDYQKIKFQFQNNNRYKTFYQRNHTSNESLTDWSFKPHSHD